MTKTTQPTTAQSLGALLKSARDIMRKDKGLNGDLDRLPMLTWIMFLKFLDDLEIQREGEAKLAGKKFRPAIEPPYRWRDWAAKSDGIAGDELLTFINQEECTRPDGKRGAGLFAYLRKLTNSNGDDKREVIATVFGGVDNRMKSGYLLRDVINKIGGIHFTSSGELHTLGSLYESMLREMRDAAGDSGEFYTPRAVVRCMVEVMNPRLGETVLDPACGTGGFLVEAFNHLSRQVKTVADRKVLQEKSLLGCEAKPLPFLLSQMNILLHGLDAPQIDPGNALRFKLTEIGERDRVDVILTNPPFGGEEEKGVQGNFPEDKQTAETAMRFLQLIMRKLRKHSLSAMGRGIKGEVLPDRGAVVVPNGTLFGDGVCARIEEELHQNHAHPVRGIRTFDSMVGIGRPGIWSRRKRARVESFRRRIADPWLQPRPQEPARQGRHHAPAAGATCRQHPEERATHRGNCGDNSKAAGQARRLTGQNIFCSMKTL